MPVKKKVKVFKKKVADFGVDIKMKNEDGSIEQFVAEADTVTPAKVKKAPKEEKKENEETLAMLEQILSGPSSVKKGKKGKKKKSLAVDFSTRVLNDYGENPHL